MNPCSCFERKYCSQIKSLGSDANFADITLELCSVCHKHWLHYLYEIEGISKSGRWFRCPVSVDQIQKMTAESALAILEASDQTHCGGSYFDGKIGRWRGAINL